MVRLRHLIIKIPRSSIQRHSLLDSLLSSKPLRSTEAEGSHGFGENAPRELATYVEGRELSPLIRGNQVVFATIEIIEIDASKGNEAGRASE